ncbi:MAG: hypothetical protein PHS37_00635 [Candidatus Omnitrophica bacterium]|nr:hypothetical protein [Candidatus Omnitrophota bacterium]
MKKICSIVAGAFMIAMLAVTVSFAAESTNVPCGGRPAPAVCPKCQQNPCVCVRPTTPAGFYKRDVLGHVVPTRTEHKGTWHASEASGYKDSIITGSGKDE